MANLMVWLLALAWPIARKVLVMLGIGWMSYEAITTLINNVIQHAQSNWGQMTGAALQICSVGGIPSVLGIITGALVARGTFIAVGRFTKLSS